MCSFFSSHFFILNVAWKSSTLWGCSLLAELSVLVWICRLLGTAHIPYRLLDALYRGLEIEMCWEAPCKL